MSGVAERDQQAGRSVGRSAAGEGSGRLVVDQVGITFTALFAFLAALLMLPARVLGGGPAKSATA